MSTMLPVTIDSDGTPMGTAITVNGQEALNVTHLRYEIGLDDVATLTLTCDVAPFKLNGRARLSLASGEPETHAFVPLDIAAEQARLADLGRRIHAHRSCRTLAA